MVRFLSHCCVLILNGSIQGLQEGSPTLSPTQHETDASRACIVSPHRIRSYLLRAVGKIELLHVRDRTKHIQLDSVACHQFVP